VACKFLPGGYERVEVLTACRRVQEAAIGAGLRASSPLGGPFMWRGAAILVDSWLPAPPPADGSDPDVRRAMAEGLSRCFAAVRHQDEPDLASSRLSLASLDTRAYVHESPSWLSELMTTAFGRLTAYDAPPAVVHLDWRTQNVRLDGAQIVAIYDWDSVALETEARAVGDAAAMFSVVYGLPNSSVPTPEEARAFVEDYEASREHDFTAEERDVIGAAVVRKLGGQAHLEHDGDPTGRKLGPLSIRTALLEHGLEYWRAVVR
jgi:hypothetical protein